MLSDLANTDTSLTHQISYLGDQSQYTSHSTLPTGYVYSTVPAQTIVSTDNGIVTTVFVQQTTVVVKKESHSAALSRGGIAGVVVGTLGLLLLVGVYLWWRRRGRVKFLYGISNLDFGASQYVIRSAQKAIVIIMLLIFYPVGVDTSSDPKFTDKMTQARGSDVSLSRDTLLHYKQSFRHASFSSDTRKLSLSSQSLQSRHSAGPPVKSSGTFCETV